ncbi:Plasmodium vivax Vir protein, putative [Plasmodium vivax]|uniref:Vir protein, putative n=1 Tax=Plasmodium vivax TaxID=5855 RepID=A0A1G4E984_PLAVI|nr:Plasmodium vivax Vir protein, putative [Plasmodium vivax]
MPDHRNDIYYSIGHCKLLNYWLYDQVKKILRSDHKDKYEKTVKDLHSAWNRYNDIPIFLNTQKYQCNPESTIPTLEEIEDKIPFHEHCLNYYNISNKQNNNVCQMYKNSIRGKSLSYEKFKSLFSEDKKEYPDYYKKCKSYNPIKIIDALHCPKEFEVDPDSEDNSVEKELESASGDKQGVHTRGEGPSTLGGEVVTENQPELPEPSKLLEEVGPSRVEDERGASAARQEGSRLEEARVANRESAGREDTHIPGSNIETSRPELAEDLQAGKGRRQSELPELVTLKPKETGDLRGEHVMITSMDGNTIDANMQPKVGTIGATLAGSSVFLLMMYKYTPLGSWVSTRILGRNQLMENMRKNNYELLLNDVGNNEASLSDTMYYISYNSSSNQ